MTPEIDRLKKMSTVLRVLTDIYGLSKEIDGTMFIFQSKPRHVTPQIDLLGKDESLFSGVPTHIYDVSKDIDGKT